METIAVVALLVATAAILAIPVLLIRDSRRDSRRAEVLERTMAALEQAIAEQKRQSASDRGVLLELPRAAPRAINHRPERHRVGFDPDRSAERERA